MKIKNLLAAFAFATSVFIAQRADAQTATSYSADDLFLGFRATSGNQSYVINLGQASQFTSAPGAFAVSGLGDIATDLVAVFGQDTTDPMNPQEWYQNRPDILWSISGTSGSFGPVGNDPKKTLYATRQRNSPGTQSSPWLRGSDTSQGVTTSKMVSMAARYTSSTSTANSPGKGVSQDNSVSNSYASYQPGGSPFNNNGGISFAAFNPTCEGDFTTGVANSVLDLYRMTFDPNVVGQPTNPGDFVGTFTIASDGTLTFTPAVTGPGTVAFASATYSQAESASGDVTKTITVNRTGGTTGAAAVDVVLVTGGSAGTATDSVDFTLPASPVHLTWANGDNVAKTFDVTIKQDALVEGNETVILDLSNVTGATLGTTTRTTLTISDPPPVGSVAFSSATYSQTEPASGTVAMTITVNRTGGSSGAVTVEATVDSNSPGTASSTNDYTLSTPVTLSWANGDTAAKTFDITVKADALTESAETINLKLQSATNGLSIDSQNNTAVATINDLPQSAGTLAFSAAQFTQAEPSSGTVVKSITVTRTGGSSGAASVVVSVTGGTANNPDDYALPVSNTLSWNAGDATSKSFDITVKADAAVESAETVTLSLGSATGATTSGQTTTTLTVTDGTVIVPLAQLGGSYNGLLTPATDPLLHSGLINVKVTTKGTFTGKVTLGGVALPISGAFNALDGAGRFGKTLTSTFELVKKAKPANISLGFLSLNLDITGGNKVTGTLKNSGGTTLFGTISNADRALYTSKKTPVAPYLNVPATILDATKEKGKYTAIFQATANGGKATNTFPQGDGYSAVTVSTAGVVKVLGKLADGTTVSYSNALSKNNELPLFIQLYSKAGFISGNIVFSNQAQTDAVCAGMIWFKPDTSAARAPLKPYPAGWPNGITTDFIASKYFVPTKPSTKNPTPPNPDTVLGLGVPGALVNTTDNIFITLADGGLTTNTSNDANLSDKSKVTVHGATAASTAATLLKTAFVPATGAMSGSFTHPGTGKAVKFAGVAFQKTNTASGFFIFLPPKTAAPGTLAESGAVGVAKK